MRKILFVAKVYFLCDIFLYKTKFNTFFLFSFFHSFIFSRTFAPVTVHATVPAASASGLKQ